MSGNISFMVIAFRKPARSPNSNLRYTETGILASIIENKNCPKNSPEAIIMTKNVDNLDALGIYRYCVKRNTA